MTVTVTVTVTVTKGTQACILSLRSQSNNFKLLNPKLVPTWFQQHIPRVEHSDEMQLIWPPWAADMRDHDFGGWVG